MTLKSMTGFARTDGVHGETSWFWEVRSVNGRSLDFRLRLPSGLERLEAGARSLCQEKLARGNCTVSLGIKRESGRMEIGLGDGTKRMFNPGEILQVEDLTGQGHTTRSVGNRITASVPLA